MNNAIIILSIVCFSLILFLLVRFLRNWLKFKFMGSSYIYIAACFLICFVYALFSNLFVQSICSEAKASSGNVPLSIATSLFEAIKMMAVAFDKEKIAPFLSGNAISKLFGYGYIIASVSALLFTSISVILSFTKTLGIKSRTFFKTRCPKNEIFYLFSDPAVPITIRLAGELKNDGKIVIIFLSKASQKTQVGLEYKDKLISKGFDVRTESFGYGLCDKIFSQHFNKSKRRVYVYGLFSSDDYSLDMAENFYKVIGYNKRFRKIKRKVFFENKYSSSNKIDDLLNNILLKPNENDSKDEKDEKNKMRINALCSLSSIIGINQIVDMKNKTIKNFIKRNRLSDDSLCYLLEALKKELKEEEIIKQGPNAINGWREMLISISKEEILSQETIDSVQRFKVYLTYHESDMDFTKDYSGTTLHILNTLSEYDMISSEFVLNNQITNFIELPMNEKEIYEDNDNYHVTFLGFGKINRPIFDKMTYAYQLWGDNIKKVHYHIWDQKSQSFAETLSNYFNDSEKKNEDYPYLYDIKAELDGQNLQVYETIDRAIENAFSQPNRFVENGFEIFVVSVCNTLTDIQIASSLRKAILKRAEKNKRAKKTIIFVRVANRNVVDGYYSTKTDIKSQELINGGYLFKDDEKEGRVDAPIVIFGENALMSKYISEHLSFIDNVGKASMKSYYNNDMLKVEKAWLLSPKKEVLSNIQTVYSMKAKLKLLGYSLSNNYKIETKNGQNDYSEFVKSLKEFKDVSDNGEKKEYIPIEDYSKEIQLIASLEHNRWLASTYSIYKSDQRSFDDFKDDIKYIEKEHKITMKTKTENCSSHICMVTNKGLKELRGKIMSYGKSKKFDLKLLQEKVDELVYLNDIKAMKDIYLAIGKK